MACGDQVTLNEIIGMLKEICGKDISANYGPERKGDVRHSKASIDKISKILNYEPKYRFEKGLKYMRSILVRGTSVACFAISATS